MESANNYQSSSQSNQPMSSTFSPNNDSLVGRDSNISGDVTDFAVSKTMRAVDQGESAMTVAIESGTRSKRICLCCPRKIRCSNRLTMAKTKILLYLFPTMLVAASFHILRTQQDITSITALLTLTLLLSSYIGLWIVIILVLTLFQITLMVRDCIFSCIVKR